MLGQSIHDKQLGVTCTDAVATLLFDKPRTVRKEDVLHEIVKGDDWDEQDCTLVAGLKYCPQDIIERYALYYREYPITSDRTVWACTMAQRLCENKKPPQERPIDFAPDGISMSLADAVVEPIDGGWSLPLPMMYRCSLFSNKFAALMDRL